MAYISILLVLTFLSLPCLVRSYNCSYHCEYATWKCWYACSRSCGGGTRVRTRNLCCKDSMPIEECREDCGVASADLKETEPCNEQCEGGTLTQDGCECPAGSFGYCCQQSDADRTKSDTCAWDNWGEWSDCQGSESGTRTRQREPVCKDAEIRADCMTRCNYTDDKNDAWAFESCVTDECYSYSAATALTFGLYATTSLVISTLMLMGFM